MDPSWTPHGPPTRIETSRLLLRPWVPGDVPLLAEAIERSEAELGRWTPWVIPSREEVDGLEGRIRAFRERFDAGDSFVYGVFDRAGRRAIGQAGLYARVGPHALEVGYWIRTDATGRGHASEATWALTAVAFRDCGVERVEARCDPGNLASVAILRRLGFSLREVLDADPSGPDRERRPLMVWEMLRAVFESTAVPARAGE